MFTSYSVTGTEDVDKIGEVPQVVNRAHAFFDSYTQLQGTKTEGTPFWTSPNAHVLNSYDSMMLLLEAADRAEPDNEGRPDRLSVYHALLATKDRNAVNGASGTVDFGAVPRAGDSYAGASPAEKVVPVYRVKGIGPKPEIEFITAVHVQP